MAPREGLECVDRLLRDLTGVEAPFGGKVLVLGDFRQVLPVMPHSSREDVVSHSLKAHTYKRLEQILVHPVAQNMRARDDGDVV